MLTMTDPKRKTVVIFGSSRPKPGSPEYQQAYEVGKMLAEIGYAIANGGYGGTMAAAAQGAAENRANPDDCTIIGVTCDAFGRSGPNQWIDKEIRTKNLNERLETLINLAYAYIVLPGSTGTLLEIALVWELINKHFLPSRPIIFLSQYWKPVTDTILQAGEVNAETLVFADTLDQLRQVLSEIVN
jgi:uncharacterized protein (TIGR00725 family)